MTLGFFDFLKSCPQGEEFSFPEALENLKESLILADTGMETAGMIASELKKRRGECLTPAAFRVCAADVLTKILSGLSAPPMPQEAPGFCVVFLFGVNGAGKTSAAVKLARFLRTAGKKVLLAAGDTYRAAAIEQLVQSAGASGFEVIRQKHGSDAAAVLFDALTAARSRGFDLLICDTAGRLPADKGLMEELVKADRTVASRLGEADRIIRYLVVDGRAGQNAAGQARTFGGRLKPDGLILTKTDSGFKSGVLLRIAAESGPAVAFRTFGEGPDDLEPFDIRAFSGMLAGEE